MPLFLLFSLLAACFASDLKRSSRQCSSVNRKVASPSVCRWQKAFLLHWNAFPCFGNNIQAQTEVLHEQQCTFQSTDLHSAYFDPLYCSESSMKPSRDWDRRQWHKIRSSALNLLLLSRWLVFLFLINHSNILSSSPSSLFCSPLFCFLLSGTSQGSGLSGMLTYWSPEEIFCCCLLLCWARTCVCVWCVFVFICKKQFKAFISIRSTHKNMCARACLARRDAQI